MFVDIINSLPFIFGVSVFVGVIIYVVGMAVAAKGEKTAGKVAPYACGEDLPSRHFQVGVEEFLIYAVYFLIFDIVAFTLATSMGNKGYFPAVYAIVVLMAVAILTTSLR